MFKPGDKALCINDHQTHGELNKGSTYIVYDVKETYVRVHYSNTWFVATRFIPVGGIPKKPTTGKGVKHDQNKPDMALLSPIALVKIAQVMTYGKSKYGSNNWRGGFAWTRPLSAALRHLFAYIGGEDKDAETGISHLAHACCCLMFVLEFEETHKELDDRYQQQKKEAK